MRRFLHIILLFTLSSTLLAQFTDKYAMFIVADGNALNNAEQKLYDRLDAMGFALIEVVSQTEVFDGAEAGFDLVVISATVTSGTVADGMPSLALAESPIIVWEPALYDHLGFSVGDGGEFGSRTLRIVNNTHQLSAGLPLDTVAITEIASKQISYGMPEGDVTIIAVNPLDSSQVAIFGYETGATMSSGTAPARRVGTFLLNDVADTLSAEGWALVDASIYWAMNYDPASAIDEGSLEMPDQFILYHNYPNPFNPSTTISYYLPTSARVEISVWNIIGEKVADLANASMPAGEHTLLFKADNLPSGVYISKAIVNGVAYSRKMLLVK